LGNHPDFVQTFGNLGHGSMGHIIEGNIVKGIESGQLTQLSGNLMKEIGDWTFRNNIFMDIALGASCTIPNVKYYNNVFYRTNYVNGGAALNFGSRAGEISDVDESTEGYALLSTPVLSGQLEEGEEYIVRGKEVNSGEIRSGIEYRVLDIARGATITYNGVVYKGKETFIGGSTTTFTVQNTAIVQENGFITYNGEKIYTETKFIATPTKTFVANSPDTKVWRRMYNRAHGAQVFNNVFYGVGNQEYTQKGWYSFGTELKDVAADYNFVAKEDGRAVREDTQKRVIGGATGWDFQAWYEPHGINGGLPGFKNIAGLDFSLTSGSILRDKAKALPQVLTDFLGVARPQGAAPDIGAYEFR
jgi:hypothetical protein